jgi:hypothetical protein
MLFVTDIIQVTQRVTYKETSWKVWRFQIRGQMILIAKYAEEFVLPAKKEKALRGLTYRLIEIGRCNIPVTFEV